VAKWEPQDHYQGWTNILHGGIQATMLDEIGSWFVFARLKKGCVTSRLDIRYRKAVPTDQGAISLRARLIKAHSRIVEVEVLLYGPDGSLCSHGTASYFMYDPKSASEKLMFPGNEDAFQAK
jgi:acyl-coenzyme A thioesterase PaaI-like protein